jgi:hypothetical protein
MGDAFRSLQREAKSEGDGDPPCARDKAGAKQERNEKKGKAGSAASVAGSFN